MSEKNVFDVAKKKIKEKASVPYETPLKIDKEYVRLSDVLAVLGDLQKTHILVSKERLREQLREHKRRHNLIKCLCKMFITEVSGMKAEKLLEPSK